MKITRLEIIKLSQPYSREQAWRFSGGKVDVWNTTLVRLTAEDGTIGLGEIGDGHFVPEAAEAMACFYGRMLQDLSVFDTNLLYDRLYKAGHFWGRRGLALDGRRGRRLHLGELYLYRLRRADAHADLAADALGRVEVDAAAEVLGRRGGRERVAARRRLLEQVLDDFAEDSRGFFHGVILICT